MPDLNRAWNGLKARIFGKDPRHLWRRYFIAILFVALSLLFSNFAPKASLDAVEANAEIIDVAGRQRMLSQRILFLSALAASEIGSDETSHEDLKAAITEFEASQNDLANVRRAWREKAPDSGSAELDQNLDESVAEFVTLAREIESQAINEDGRPKLNRLIEIGSNDLLRDLDAAVQRDEKFLLSKVRYVETIANICLILALLILFFEVIFIYLPAHRLILGFLSEREKFEEKLTLKNEELEHFTYVAAHDLRGPLRGMENLTGWIEEDVERNDLSETPSHIALLKTRISRMNNLLTDMLAFAKIGKAKSEKTTFELKDAINEVVQWVDVPDEFTIHLDPSLPKLTAPMSSLQQIFFNVINNAVKHHDRDKGQIDIIYRPDKTSHIFIIADDGPGIPSEYRDYIFKPFNRLAARDEVEGSGIGLSITQKLVESLGGTIHLDRPQSESDRGTAFRIILPKQDMHSNPNS